jgi:hypothetical protein
MLSNSRCQALAIAIVCAAACGKSSKGAEPAPTTTDPGNGTNSSSQSASPAKITSVGQAYIMEWTWTSPLVALGSVKAQFTVRLPDNSVPQKVSDIEIDPWMPSMGHGTYRGDQKVTSTDQATGSFDVQGLYFTMGGPWELRIDAVVNGVKDRALLSVEIP